MKNRKNLYFLILGAVLLLTGLILFGVTQLRSHSNDRKLAAALSNLETLLPDRTPGVPELHTDTRMPVLSIDGTDYVALLEVPGYDIALPVADQWGDGTPARYYGSAYNGSLVIGGADREGNFAFCSQVDLDQTLTLTDMTGSVFTYRVDRIDRSDEVSAQWLIQEDYPLTLYCRDTKTADYIALRCHLTTA